MQLVGVAKALFNSGEKVEIYGFQDGYQGLIYGRFKLLTYATFTALWKPKVMSVPQRSLSMVLGRVMTFSPSVRSIKRSCPNAPSLPSLMR